MYRKERI
jgi:hypothetical protein